MTNPTLKYIIFSVLIVFSLFFSEICFAQISADRAFADYLFTQGEYYRAITEYYRLLFATKDSSTTTILLKNIGLCYFNGESYDEYISFLNTHRKDFQANPQILEEMDLHLGKSYYFLGEYPKAITTLEWSNVSFNNSLISEAQFLLGLSYARIFSWQAAAKQFKLIDNNSSFKQFSNIFISSEKELVNLTRKSPALAGVFSTIIPGSGYIYCNRLGTGFTSLLINGLLIWTCRDAIANEQYGLAAATGFFGMGWYIGNIKGSVDAARVYNANKRHRYINDLLEKANCEEYGKPIG